MGPRPSAPASRVRLVVRVFAVLARFQIFFAMTYPFLLHSNPTRRMTRGVRDGQGRGAAMSLHSRRWMVGLIALGILAWIGDGSNTALGQDKEAERAVAIKERDRLWDETQKLRADGKTAEALAAAEAMLA